jgi:Xaa-Pro dipeptidase
MHELDDAMKTFSGKLYINEGVNSDSNLKTCLPDSKYLQNHTVDRPTMHDILAESRVIKNDEEIVAMRWASQITAEAHVNVMRNVKANMREMQLESFFNFYGQQHYFTGRVAPYLPICGCGPSAATLHYHDNRGLLKDGTTMLTDQGHSLHHYTSDVTTSWPVNGKFTKKQADIYNLVLRASRAVFEQLKPGTDWIEMHKLAERVILGGLVDLGCLTGDVEEMLEKRLGFLFMPHGLGHLIGLDIHDVGGYLPTTPERRSEPGLKNVRTARIIEVGVVLTIEPGCYFRDFLLNGEVPKEFYDFDLSYLNRDKIREYQQEIQGVRIEDVVLITETGNENFSYDIPRTVEQIEKCMSGQEWRQ